MIILLYLVSLFGFIYLADVLGEKIKSKMKIKNEMHPINMILMTSVFVIHIFIGALY